jgi:anti-sigma regulatory factor (Ser/Thr protein kinase)
MRDVMVRALEFPGRPASVRDARVFAGEVLADAGVEPSVIETAQLAVSELVTNAVVHARGQIRVTVDTDPDRVRVEVEDQGRGRPVLRPPTRDRLGGRGLWVVDRLATGWGTERRAGGRALWFEIA